jgi:hypothetical protein
MTQQRSTEAGDRSASRSRHVPEPVQVRNWPLRDEPWTWLMACGYVVIGGSAVVASNSIPMGLMITLALVAASWRIFVPVRFSFSSKGIVQTTLGLRRRISWRELARYEYYPRGALLLRDAERTFLSPLNGVFIKWDGQRAELMRLLEYYMDRQSVPAGSSTESYLTESRRLSQGEDLTTPRP